MEDLLLSRSAPALLLRMEINTSVNLAVKRIARAVRFRFICRASLFSGLQ